MTLNDSEKKLLDAMLAGARDSEIGLKNYLEVYDGNFEAVSKSVNDGVIGMLANAGIAIAEQKKLLQSAKTPEALQNAIKLLAVTAGNLVSAGTGLLKWMGKQLPQRDSTDDVEVKDLGENYGLGFLSWLGKRLPKRDSLLQDCDVVMGVSDGDANYAVVRRNDVKDYAVVVGDSCVVGFSSLDKAINGLGSLLKWE